MKWAHLAAQARQRHGTPLYLFAWDPVQRSLQELAALETTLPIRHWLSVKTTPLRHLIRRWTASGRPVEVVSEAELRGCLGEGVSPSDILVNGVAKHMWLPGVETPALRVHLDSIAETEAICSLAQKRSWRIGLRLLVEAQYDPDEPEYRSQFGLSGEELPGVLELLRKSNCLIEGIHFHLRSNVACAEDYRNAIQEVADTCRQHGIAPSYLDCGGGLPSPGETVDQKHTVDLGELRDALSTIPKLLPSVTEIWMENGRFVTAAAGVLAVSVIDVKQRPECRYLICDGGRVNHALVSDWETHRLEAVPARQGDRILTTICGPTCMAFDRLGRFMLSDSIQVGDMILWHHAGAYHIPWETRFSHVLAPVVWIANGDRMELARPRESMSDWWELH